MSQSQNTAIFKREIFLNIEKKRNSLAVKIAEKKGRWFTHFRFVFASLWKSKLLNPRSARYAWGLVLIREIKFPTNKWFRIVLTLYFL
jgi:hypothetical protein